MGVGELGNFAAYGFAPASLIAPLGCVSVIGECDLFPLIHYQCYKAEGKVAFPGNDRMPSTYDIEFVDKFTFLMSSDTTQTQRQYRVVSRRAEVFQSYQII